MNTVSHSKLFSAHRTLDTLKVDPPHLSGRNQPSTFRAYGIERQPHLFEINLLPAGHGLGILDRSGVWHVGVLPFEEHCCYITFTFP